MSVVSEIKCGKCDRMYSGLRSKSPYCGTRRISRGKYSEDRDNSSGKILIAVLIMSVFVVATGVLLFTTEVPEPPPPVLEDVEEEDPDESELDGYVSLPAAEPVIPEPEEDEEEQEEPEIPLEARTISVRYGNNPLILGSEGREFSFNVGDSLTLTVRIEPLGVEDEIIWESSNDGIFSVTPNNPEKTEAIVRAIGRGTARMSVSVGDLTETVIVRVPR